MSYEIDLKVKESQELGLLRQDLLRCDCSVSNLLMHNLGMKWVNILVFGGEIHCCDTDCMDIFVNQSCSQLFTLDKILIKDLSGEEVGPFAALEGCGHFHHPVCHLGPIFFGYLVSLYWVWK